MDGIPKHRAAMRTRSGDTHVIGADGAARNVDEEARAAAVRDVPGVVTDAPLAGTGAGTQLPESGSELPPARRGRATKDDTVLRQAQDERA